MTSIATHTDPALRADADFLIEVDLSHFGMSDRKEQLWVRRLDGEGRFSVCCLPFFTNGVALNDEVLATLDEREQFVFQRVLKKSGHRILRFALHDLKRASETHELVHTRLLNADLRHEWYASGYGAVDLASNEDEKAARDILNETIGPKAFSLEVQ